MINQGLSIAPHTQSNTYIAFAGIDSRGRCVGEARGGGWKSTSEVRSGADCQYQPSRVLGMTRGLYAKVQDRGPEAQLPTLNIVCFVTAARASVQAAIDQSIDE